MANVGKNLNPAFDILRNIPIADSIKGLFGFGPKSDKE